MASRPTEGAPLSEPTPLTPNHPGYGPLCARCGTAAEAQDHGSLCRPFASRPDLWASGWVDLNAFGLTDADAVGFPEVREGPIAVVAEGGLGPSAIWAKTGAWVRTPDDGCPTRQRVAALSVLRAARPPGVDEVEAVIAAGPIEIDSWCEPALLAIATTGCGRNHRVRVDRGVATAPNHRDSASHRFDPTFTVSTTAPCSQVLERWETADVGRIVTDLTVDPHDRYQHVAHDPAVNSALQILMAATHARVRCELISAGEPDRWLHLATEPVAPGTAATLNESTRPLPIALVRAPPTWLWSGQRLG